MELTRKKILAAQRVLADNGIEISETPVVTEALGSILLDMDLSDLIEYDTKKSPTKKVSGNRQNKNNRPFYERRHQMHSLIIQLQKELDPNNIISESDYDFDGPSGDLCPFADYYSSINERHRRQILDELSLHGIAINGDTFTITDKSVYFKDYYINFKKNLKLLSSVNEDDFISDNYTVDGNIHSLNKEYNDRYGI